MSMITDKGYFDAVWCPQLWVEPRNDKNRVKPDRDYEPLESIHQALQIGEKTKHVIITDISPLGRMARPNGESFWLHVPFREGKFLLTTHSFILDPITSGEGVLTVIRQKRHDPRDDETYKAEIHLHFLMHRYISPFFPRVKQVRIVSQYPTVSEQVTIDPTEANFIEADEFACYINDQKEGRAKLVPRYDKCSMCWWKSCGARLNANKAHAGFHE